MAYFAASLARTDDGWSVSDTDLDDIEDLVSLADHLRKFAVEDEPVVLVLEQEDLWFGIVRVDGEEDPRVFVSDASAAARSSYGDVLLSGTEVADLLERDADGADGADGDQSPAYPPAEPVGDNDILADLGTPPDALLELCAQGSLPTDAVTAVAERAGCADQLESVR